MLMRSAEPVAPPLNQCAVAPFKLPKGATLYRTALVLPENLAKADWETLGRALANQHDSIQWWLGDWWRFGSHNREYGKRAAIFAKGIFRHSFETLMNYGVVAAKVPTSLRNEVLSFSHHAMVSSLTHAEQKRWLAKAAQQNWSVSQLRQWLRMVENNTPDPTDEEMVKSLVYDLFDQSSRAWSLALRFQIADEYAQYLPDETIANLAHEAERIAECWRQAATTNREYQKQRQLARHTADPIGNEVEEVTR